MHSSTTAISLFSGCGGFDYGATKAGANIIWANDIDPVAASVYKQLLPDTEFALSDIREVKHFPKADILIGCYPCTGFSVAARRKWKNRSTRDLMDIKGNFLYLEFLRALNESQPLFFFVENVRGMVTAQKGWFFQQQLEGFKKQGYSVKYSLLNAVDYGVAQSRQRIFIVGIREDIAKEFDYDFLPPTNVLDSRSAKTLNDVIGHMDPWPEGEFLERKFHGHYLTRNRKRRWDQPSFTIVANPSHVPLHPGGEPMVYVKKDTWALKGSYNRRLSWRECAAIQDLPTNIEPIGGISGKYRVVGNAVPPTFGKILLRPVITYLNNSN
ncbi:MAG: DNA (cytosine-5-)-methyltransferase [Candidatus Electrothrix sp. ATG2]|nr:DNA (cytosine-5-)-methyltransferase [Candidatus Electrothrix sp. ATG2]